MIRFTTAALWAVALVFAALGTASAETLEEQGARIKAEHRAAAEKFFASMAGGVHLTGTVSENGSPGLFDAYFLDDVWVVNMAFGDMVSKSYSGPDGDWTGSSYALPFKLEPLDNPASTTLSLLSDGKYMDEPYWSQLVFTGEDAGGYNFAFSPVMEVTDEAGETVTTQLPVAKLVLYSDPGEPQYLQVMSAEVELAPLDTNSSTYRSFYYYQQDASGNIYTQRETGREIDSQGDTSSYSEYTVTEVLPLDALPESARFSLERTPPGGVSNTLTAPVEVPVDTDSGYFLVPLTFEGSDKTWNFIFDTGASASLFTPEAAAAAGLVPDVTIPAHGHGSRVEFEIGLCRTATVGAAVVSPELRAPLAPFPAARIDESSTDVLGALKQYDAAGILGISLLHQYIVKFDHLKGVITLYPPNSFNAEAEVPLPNVEFWLDAEDLVFVMARVSDGKLAEPLRGEMVLDTGLQQQLALLEETVELRGLDLPKVSERNNTVLGGTRKFDYVRLPLFEIGPLNWQNVETSLTSDDKGTLSGRGVLGFLGVPFFWGTQITVDLFNQRMWVRPTDEAEMQKAVQELKDRMGITGSTGDETTDDAGTADEGTASDDAAADEENDAEQPRGDSSIERPAAPSEGDDFILPDPDGR